MYVFLFDVKELTLLIIVERIIFIHRIILPLKLNLEVDIQTFPCLDLTNYYSTFITVKKFLTEVLIVFTVHCSL